MAVINHLKTIREERGLLQEDLASATGFWSTDFGRCSSNYQPDQFSKPP